MSTRINGADLARRLQARCVEAVAENDDANYQLVLKYIDDNWDTINRFATIDPERSDCYRIADTAKYQQ